MTNDQYLELEDELNSKYRIILNEIECDIIVEWELDNPKKDIECFWLQWWESPTLYFKDRESLENILDFQIEIYKWKWFL